MAVAEIADLKRRRLHSRAGFDSPLRSVGGTGFHRIYAKHQRDDSIFAASGGVCDADGDAIGSDNRKKIPIWKLWKTTIPASSRFRRRWRSRWRSFCGSHELRGRRPRRRS